MQYGHGAHGLPSRPSAIQTLCIQAIHTHLIFVTYIQFVFTLRSAGINFDLPHRVWTRRSKGSGSDCQWVLSLSTGIDLSSNKVQRRHFEGSEALYNQWYVHNRQESTSIRKGFLGQHAKTSGSIFVCVATSRSAGINLIADRVQRWHPGGCGRISARYIRYLKYTRYLKYIRYVSHVMYIRSIRSINLHCPIST